MGYIETLIYLRVNYFLNELSNYLSHLLVDSPFEVADIELSTWTHQFYHRFYFQNGWSLIIYEKYIFAEYQLKISRYHYALLHPQNEPHLSFDNCPHHRNLFTFPHHKHFYPKHNHSPMIFSGEIADAFEEIKWIMENL